MLLYQILAFTIHGKIEKNSYKNNKPKYQFQHGMKNFNY